MITSAFKKLWNSPTFTTWASFVVRVGGLMLLTPLILTKFSPEEISLWYLFSSIIGLTVLLDLGFAPTLARIVAFAYAGAEQVHQFKTPSQTRLGRSEPNWMLVSRIHRTSGLIYLVLAFGLGLALATVGSAAIYRPIVGLSNPPAGWWAWLFLCVGGVVTFYGTRYSSLLTGLDRVAEVNRSTTISTALAIVCSAIVVILGGGLAVLVLTYQSILVIRVLLFRNQVLRIKQLASFRSPLNLGYDREVLSAAWQPSWRSALIVAGSTGVANATGLIYAQIYDSRLLADFLFTLRVFQVITTFSQAPFYSRLPLFARLRAEGRLGDLGRECSRRLEISLYVFLAASLGVGIFANAALSLIDAKALLITGPFWSALVVVYFMERHHAMHAQIYCTTNHIPFHFTASVSGLFCALLLFALAPRVGIWAFPISLGVSNAVLNNWWSVYLSMRSLPSGERARFRSAFFRAGLCMVIISGFVVIY